MAICPHDYTKDEAGSPCVWCGEPKPLSLSEALARGLAAGAVKARENFYAMPPARLRSFLTDRDPGDEG